MNILYFRLIYTVIGFLTILLGYGRKKTLQKDNYLLICVITQNTAQLLNILSFFSWIYSYLKTGPTSKLYILNFEDIFHGYSSITLLNQPMKRLVTTTPTDNKHIYKQGLIAFKLIVN